MKLLYIGLLLITGCGFSGNQRLTTQGETRHRIELDLLFIEQVQELCETIHPYDPVEAAQCTIDNMALLNVNLDGSLEAVCPTGDVPPALEEFCLDPGPSLDGF